MIALAPTPTLHGDRLTLRAPQGADWPHWRAFAMSERSRFVRFDDSAATAWRAFGHVIGHWAMRGYGTFVFHRHDDPTPLGAAGPWFPEGWPEPEIGWTLWSADHEGHGFATEAAQVALDHARETLGWAAPVSYIDPQNAASIAVATRLGATRDPRAETPHAGDLVYRHGAVA